MTMVKAHDFPIDEVAESAQRAIASGHTVYQKFTCTNCDSRQTIDDANQFYKFGKCEACGHVTEITQCNYLAIKTVRGDEADQDVSM